jgi:Na+/H+ antiporter NhaD/arsenite permease-like protein
MMMFGIIKGLLGFLFKLFIVGLAATAIVVAVVVFLLKKDVEELKEFTEQLKREGLEGLKMNQQ